MAAGSAAPFPRAVLFDLDDTILNDGRSVDACWGVACREGALAAGEAFEPERLLELVYVTRDWFWPDPERHRTGRADLRAASAWIVAEALRNLGREDTALAGRISEHYRDLREQAIELIPGAVETLAGLRDRGLPLGLITNGAATAQRAKIERFGLARHFEFICVEGEFGCGKADEHVYRAGLSALNVEPVSTWMVGDNFAWDVAAPVAMGMTGVWIDRERQHVTALAEDKSHFVLSSVAELPQLLDSLVNGSRTV